MVSENIVFFTDSKDPKISRTEPRRGYASGVFDVEFKEENPETLTLFYGLPGAMEQHDVNLNEACYEDRSRTTCSSYVDLSGYNGEEISYYYFITDRVGNEDISRSEEVDVDTEFPILENFNYTIDGRAVTFEFWVTEENFDEIEYWDNQDSRPRWTRLCSRLDDAGYCDKKKTFRSGSHSLDIQVLDEAGNAVGTHVEFIVN